MTEHNFLEEIEEDFQRQKLEALWKRYGNLVIAGAGLIVLGTAIITAAHSWRAEGNQKATAGLITIINAPGSDQVKQIDQLEAFVQQNHGKAQAAFAQLHAASLAAQRGDKDQAVKFYDALASDSSADAAFRQLADLMAVQVQLDTGTPAVLEKRLQPLLAENAPWRFTAMEYSGYLALREGNKPKAKQIFTELAQNASAPKTLNERAVDMLRYVSE